MNKRVEHPFTTYRREHDLTISQFAKLVGVDRTAISKCEHKFRDGLGRNANLQIEERTKGALNIDTLSRFVWPRHRSVRKGLRGAGLDATSGKAAQQ